MQFHEDPADVGLDRIFFDHQVPGDFVVRLAGGDQAEHVSLAGRERIEPPRHAGRRAGCASEAGDEPAGDGGVDEGIACGRASY